MPLPLAIIAGIGSLIAREGVKKGIRMAIQKFGKEAVKKAAPNVTSLRKSNALIKSARGGKKSQTKSKTASAFHRTIDPKKARGPQKRPDKLSLTDKKATPDRKTTLGRKMYNFNQGGVVGSKIATKGYGRATRKK